MSSATSTNKVPVDGEKKKDVDHSLQQPRRGGPGGRILTTRGLLLAILSSFVLAYLYGRNDTNVFRIVPHRYALCSKKGLIYTVDEHNPQVECIVIEGKHIVDSGDVKQIRERNTVDKETGVTNRLEFFFIKKGYIVVPGLADAHAHIIEHGYKRQLELDGTRSKADVLKVVENYVHAHADVLNNNETWIRGWGWDQNKWAIPDFPTAADFDTVEILKGRPISLKRIDGHSIWVSPTVIDKAGPLPDEVEGGEILRYEDGTPTGVFIDNAQLLILHPEFTDEQMLLFFQAAANDILSYGLTSVHDAASNPQMISFFKRMADEEKLPHRLYLMGNVESSVYWGDQIEPCLEYGPAQRLTLKSVKLFADGALGSWGASLLEPYDDKPDSSGLLLQSPEVLSALVKRFWDNGFQVNIHCIGDKANKVVLDIFEDLNASHSISERRPRIEHTQIITPEDTIRLGQLGVIPSVQPTHATSDMWYAASRLGTERLKYSYIYRTLLETSKDNVLPLGSDFPVEGVNPLLGFYASVSRLSVEGSSPHGKGGWYPDQRLTRAQALKGMTLDPAFASFDEHRIGSLVPGKLADYVVLDKNIMTIDFAEILKTKVVATVIDGRPAYGGL